MRARRREINIFNMSLLDILCGALGAFCFMMIVALPYYIPPGKARDLRKSQEETAKLMHDLEKMKERLPDQKSVEEMEAMLKRLEAQIKALQGQVNILTAEKEELQKRIDQLIGEKEQLAREKEQLAQENQQLRAKNESLEQDKKKLQALLAQKRPLTFLARADNETQTIDLITLPKAQNQQNPNPMFQEWLAGKFAFRNELQAAMLTARGIAIGSMSDLPPGAEFKLYLRLASHPDVRRATDVQCAMYPDMRYGPPQKLAKVTLSVERFWTLVGTVTIDQNFLPIFKEATADERDAEWKILTNATPPPTPTPTPPPSAAERAAAEAERAKFEAQRIKLREAHKKLSKLMQIPLDDSGKNDAEILQLTDELLKELPPSAGMRREVEFRRNRVLERKARREGGRQQPSPDEMVSPSPRQPAPVPSPS